MHIQQAEELATRYYRYDKTDASYLSFVSIASAFLWVSFVYGR